MSVPARRLDTPPPVPGPNTRSEPATRRRSSSTARPRRGPRGGSVGFVVIASAIAGAMVFGIVVLNVLLAQTAFRIDDAERRIEELSEERLELAREQATLSAPGRISAWASRHGMRLPDDIRILHALGEASGDPAGADPSSVESADGDGTS